MAFDDVRNSRSPQTGPWSNQTQLHHFITQPTSYEIREHDVTTGHHAFEDTPGNSASILNTPGQPYSDLYESTPQNDSWFFRSGLSRFDPLQYTLLSRRFFEISVYEQWMVVKLKLPLLGKYLGSELIYQRCAGASRRNAAISLGLPKTNGSIRYFPTHDSELSIYEEEIPRGAFRRLKRTFKEHPNDLSRFTVNYRRVQRDVATALIPISSKHNFVLQPRINHAESFQFQASSYASKDKTRFEIQNFDWESLTTIPYNMLSEIKYGDRLFYKEEQERKSTFSPAGATIPIGLGLVNVEKGSFEFTSSSVEAKMVNADEIYCSTTETSEYVSPWTIRCIPYGLKFQVFNGLIFTSRDSKSEYRKTTFNIAEKDRKNIYHIVEVEKPTSGPSRMTQISEGNTHNHENFLQWMVPIPLWKSFNVFYYADQTLSLFEKRYNAPLIRKNLPNIHETQSSTKIFMLFNGSILDNKKHNSAEIVSHLRYTHSINKEVPDVCLLEHEHREFFQLNLLSSFDADRVTRNQDNRVSSPYDIRLEKDNWHRIRTSLPSRILYHAKNKVRAYYVNDFINRFKSQHHEEGRDTPPLINSWSSEMITSTYPASELILKKNDIINICQVLDSNFILAKTIENKFNIPSTQFSLFRRDLLWAPTYLKKAKTISDFHIRFSERSIAALLYIQEFHGKLLKEYELHRTKPPLGVHKDSNLMPRFLEEYGKNNNIEKPAPRQESDKKLVISATSKKPSSVLQLEEYPSNFLPSKKTRKKITPDNLAEDRFFLDHSVSSGAESDISEYSVDDSASQHSLLPTAASASYPLDITNKETASTQDQEHFALILSPHMHHGELNKSFQVYSWSSGNSQVHLENALHYSEPSGPQFGPLINSPIQSDHDFAPYPYARSPIESPVSENSLFFGRSRSPSFPGPQVDLQWNRPESPVQDLTEDRSGSANIIPRPRIKHYMRSDNAVSETSSASLNEYHNFIFARGNYRNQRYSIDEVTSIPNPNIVDSDSLPSSPDLSQRSVIYDSSESNSERNYRLGKFPRSNSPSTLRDFPNLERLNRQDTFRRNIGIIRTKALQFTKGPEKVGNRPSFFTSEDATFERILQNRSPLLPADAPSYKPELGTDPKEHKARQRRYLREWKGTLVPYFFDPILHNVRYLDDLYRQLGDISQNATSFSETNKESYEEAQPDIDRAFDYLSILTKAQDRALRDVRLPDVDSYSVRMFCQTMKELIRYDLFGGDPKSENLEQSELIRGMFQEQWPSDFSEQCVITATLQNINQIPQCIDLHSLDPNTQKTFHHYANVNDVRIQFNRSIKVLREAIRAIKDNPAISKSHQEVLINQAKITMECLKNKVTLLMQHREKRTDVESSFFSLPKNFGNFWFLKPQAYKSLFFQVRYKLRAYFIPRSFSNPAST